MDSAIFEFWSRTNLLLCFFGFRYLYRLSSKMSASPMHDGNTPRGDNPSEEELYGSQLLRELYHCSEVSDLAEAIARPVSNHELASIASQFPLDGFDDESNDRLPFRSARDMRENAEGGGLFGGEPSQRMLSPGEVPGRNLQPPGELTGRALFLSGEAAGRGLFSSGARSDTKGKVPATGANDAQEPASWTARMWEPFAGGVPPEDISPIMNTLPGVDLTPLATVVLAEAGGTFANSIDRWASPLCKLAQACASAKCVAYSSLGSVCNIDGCSSGADIVLQSASSGRLQLDSVLALANVLFRQTSSEKIELNFSENLKHLFAYALPKRFNTKTVGSSSRREDKLSAEQVLNNRLQFALVDGQAHFNSESRKITNVGTDFATVAVLGAPIVTGKYYFELEILQSRLMQIGWANMRSKYNAREGFGVGDNPSSWSWCGERNVLFHGTDCRPRAYGNMSRGPWQKGDIVGCAIELPSLEEGDKKGKIHYWLNGDYLGVAFNNVYVRDSNGEVLPLHPAISITQNTPNPVRFNFGEDNSKPLLHVPEGWRPLAKALVGSPGKTDPAFLYAKNTGDMGALEYTLKASESNLVSSSSSERECF